jgi:hypothetical protein
MGSTHGYGAPARVIATDKGLGGTTISVGRGFCGPDNEERRHSRRKGPQEEATGRGGRRGRAAGQRREEAEGSHDAMADSALVVRSCQNMWV